MQTCVYVSISAQEILDNLVEHFTDFAAQPVLIRAAVLLPFGSDYDNGTPWASKHRMSACALIDPGWHMSVPTASSMLGRNARPSPSLTGRSVQGLIWRFSLRFGDNRCKGILNSAKPFEIHFFRLRIKFETPSVKST